jgi:hypothetical protein
MIRVLVEKGSRDSREVLKVMQLINDRPDFFELFGGEDGLRRLTAGTARVRLEDVVPMVVAETSSVPKIITMTDRLAPVRSLILSPDEQVAAWVKANKKFGKNKIPKAAFKVLDSLVIPTLTPVDMEAGYVGAVLSYGFGTIAYPSGRSYYSDMVLSAKLAWEYIASTRAVWKWDQIDFGNLKSIRPFSGKHSERPVGFYWKLVQLGHVHQNKPVQVARGLISPSDWGMGPEGIQFFLTHPHYAEMMNGNPYPFMDLPDFEISSGGDGVSSRAPCLGFYRVTSVLGLDSDDVSHPNPHYGSGSLR